MVLAVVAVVVVVVVGAVVVVLMAMWLLSIDPGRAVSDLGGEAGGGAGRRG